MLMMAPAVMATQFPGKCQQEDCKAFRKLPVNIGISSPVFLKCQRNLVFGKIRIVPFVYRLNKMLIYSARNSGHVF